MGTHMKTTVEIADDLYERAKRLAEERGTTLREVIETALRSHVEDMQEEPSGYRMRKHAFRGNGLKEGLEWGDWASLRSLIYEGQGG